jgi:hypothetical protein
MIKDKPNWWHEKQQKEVPGAGKLGVQGTGPGHAGYHTATEHQAAITQSHRIQCISQLCSTVTKYPGRTT